MRMVKIDAGHGMEESTQQPLPAPEAEIVGRTSILHAICEHGGPVRESFHRDFDESFLGHAPLL
jgi:hypothetical protein